MEGLVYMHDLAGQALRAANAEIDRLRSEVERLSAELASTSAAQAEAEPK